ncbi:NAD-dependent malic enzyme [Candidatus Falkowbacteria bacterium CG_4_9_14_3_um_filter_36_9]|uniref:NAD-dependent malic enzyme n=2 Tax=Candidatus Falkowiibacteriota TaxID=1752728 RepID=A0A1J4T3U7_9BACT|nr:MAG: NAD-dependent malic enzyme [Candidatus Falkowbacteria bacterium CG1_02_37_44]PIV51355.1 MAG: NAD-dependent malic enzyme [Candidatus Falkowbacteria bacterium CG02_land_8_20_14_3_00_36_14]PIX11936.1 MAG: NAD-dependent malic enzyme [Candidatus Falkowbacteria bacterium CG_4_8_14_3_um_filter_36_11]PJA11172.1 MAG: NAD-dependent malic enzyme [Candidatus Falkowbacteria bacterium CG_4_10_14_0_2_um_filter_36_22]PJB19290.1 MAG: NAD-dependent malic enzyme [Candidatus Falkowbacteria bacterium CG_4_9
MDYNKKSLALHKKIRGKIEIKSKISLKTKDDLSLAYTPGVAAVSSAIGRNKKLTWELTNRANQVAIITDGTAILGLGNLGPEAAMPVMEGKAAIFKEFAGIDAFPLCLNTTDAGEIVNFCKLIEPSFGGINLEDISAPRCFAILARLEKELSIPVFHDDQDGTAIIVLAAIINTCRLTNKIAKELKVVINGAGAAGMAIAKILLNQGFRDIILLDSLGTIYKGRKKLNKYKKELAVKTNRRKIKGGLIEAMAGADIFIGVSKGNLIDAEMIKSMNKAPIIFAMANPVPEIMPPAALNAGALIVGTGRSDFPNQINNALVFPGLFRGLLDNNIKIITAKIKIDAAIAIAYSIKPAKNKILPDLTDKNVVKAIVKIMKG